MNAQSMQEPYEVVLRKVPDKPIAFACGKCGILFTAAVFGGGDGGLIAAEQLAKEHCEPKLCTCGKECKKHYTICQECSDRKQVEKEAAAFEKAKKVSIEEYEGQAVYWEDGPPGSSCGDGYYSGIDELLDLCEDEGFDLPKYVWATTPVDLHIRAASILENALSEHYEDAYDDLGDKAETELQKLLDEWCAKQKIRSWEKDYGVAVLIQPAE